uniref:Uncharacterized protein n=1 Tax=Romanomermis culicivorax TaxID=13658 RepID=A0A915HWE8_ROMCU
MLIFRTRVIVMENINSCKASLAKFQGRHLKNFFSAQKKLLPYPAAPVLLAALLDPLAAFAAALLFAVKDGNSLSWKFNEDSDCCCCDDVSSVVPVIC